MSQKIVFIEKLLFSTTLPEVTELFLNKYGVSKNRWLKDQKGQKACLGTTLILCGTRLILVSDSRARFIFPFT